MRGLGYLFTPSMLARPHLHVERGLFPVPSTRPGSSRAPSLPAPLLAVKIWLLQPCRCTAPGSQVHRSQDLLPSGTPSPRVLSPWELSVGSRKPSPNSQLAITPEARSRPMLLSLPWEGQVPGRHKRRSSGEWGSSHWGQLGLRLLTVPPPQFWVSLGAWLS